MRLDYLVGVLRLRLRFLQGYRSGSLRLSRHAQVQELPRAEVTARTNLSSQRSSTAPCNLDYQHLPLGHSEDSAAGVANPDSR